MIVERMIKNGNDPVLEFGLQDGFSGFLTHKSLLIFRAQEWADNQCRPIRKTSAFAVRWNRPCKNIAHSNTSDHHLFLSMLQLKQNHTIYYFCVFLYATHEQLFATIFHEIVWFCLSLKSSPSQTNPSLDATGFVMKNHAWRWFGCYRIFDH